MVNLTVSISEETVRRLRKVIKEVYSSKKGSLSSLVEGALNEALDREIAPRRPVGFRAVRGRSLVATAENLDLLAKKLKELGVEPRGLRIESTSHLSPVVRTGPRSIQE